MGVDYGHKGPDWKLYILVMLVTLGLMILMSQITTEGSSF
jgi:hypothetical protein